MFTSVADEALAIFTETPIHVNYSLEQKSKSARSSGSPLEILEIYSPHRHDLKLHTLQIMS